MRQCQFGHSMPSLIVKIASRVDNRSDNTGAYDKIAICFMWFTFGSPPAGGLINNGQNFVFCDVFPIHARNAASAAITAQIEIVATERLAHQTDFRQHRSPAAVWTA